MFTSVCEIILGALVRARIVRNETNRFYLDLRMLNERNVSTKNGIFLPADEVHSFFEILFNTVSDGNFKHFPLGYLNKTLLIKNEPDGYVTILYQKKAGEFEFTGIRLSPQELENLRNQQTYFINTLETQQAQFPVLAQRKHKSFTPDENSLKYSKRSTNENDQTNKN